MTVRRNLSFAFDSGCMVDKRQYEVAAVDAAAARILRTVALLERKPRQSAA